jgi:excisionase family DNA binding protein
MEAHRLEPVPSPQPPPQRRRHLTREDVMTAAEVAALLALPKSTVYELARRGELPCARLGRTIRFLREEVEARLRQDEWVAAGPTRFTARNRRNDH